MLEYLWLVPLLPLVAFVIVILFGRWMWQGGALIVIVAIGISFVLSLVGMVDFFFNINHSFELVLSFEWLGSSAPDIKFGLLIDNLSVLMMTLVSFLSLLIAIYSIGYMAEDPSKPRYYAEISLFVAGMLGTVSANNYLQLLIFWEIMGLCSYLLIGFWFRKPEAASAAKKAFLVTRIGDLMLLAGIIILYVQPQIQTFNFLEIAEHAGDIDPRFVMLIPLLIFGGAIGKSAQFPLHGWLPDAMEGPTTVSALIHAATMVKAGVFLTARAFPLLLESPEAMLFVAIIGGFTAFFAATMALTAFDIKRVLAFSTISQLGYMILALGAGGMLYLHFGDTAGYSAALFHLTNHAFFKALLFLAAGSVIHAVHTNDMRLMGGLRKKLKITSLTMLIASISIAGIPPFSGFWSKDELLAGVFEAGEINTIFTLLWVLGILTAFMTAFYMFRLWFMTFGGEPRSKEAKKAHESPKVMTVPLMILAFFALASGMFIFYTQGFENVVFVEHAHAVLPMDILVHTFTSPLTYISILVAVGGIGLAYLVYQRRTITATKFTSTRATKGIHNMLSRRYWFPEGYNYIGGKIYYGFAKAIDWFDRKVIDGFVNGVAKAGLAVGKGHDKFDRKVVDGVVNGISSSAIGSGKKLRRGQRGYVQDYAAVIIIGICIVIFLIEVVFPLLGVT
jgi:NADH-quinone oxidoreductase subunit L